MFSVHNLARHVLFNMMFAYDPTMTFAYDMTINYAHDMILTYDSLPWMYICMFLSSEWVVGCIPSS